MEQADGVNEVQFVDGRCAHCNCPIIHLALGSFQYYCHVHAQMLALVAGSEYWCNLHKEWVRQEENKRKLRPGENYFT